MIPVQDLFEAHLTVSDIDRSVEFYRDVVGLQLAYVLPRVRLRSSGSAPPAMRCSDSGQVELAPSE